MTTTMKLSITHKGVTTEHSMKVPEDIIEEQTDYFVRFYAKQCAIEVIDKMLKVVK